MDLTVSSQQYFDARKALERGKPRQAATLAGQLLEDVLDHMVFDNLERFDPKLRSNIRQSEQNTRQKGKPIGLGFLVDLIRDSSVFDAVGKLTGRSTEILKTLRFSSCLKIRNRAAHSNPSPPIAADEARLLITTTEHLLAFLGADVDRSPEGDIPLQFSNSDECLRLLLQRIWRFPDAGGPRSSWAVKESSVMRGDLENAFLRPGLGIALFTTELASECFGSVATRKIQACIDWGLNQATESSPYLLSEGKEDRITGRVTSELDLRHTVALAVLMARLDIRRNHQKHYLQIVLEKTCEDGGWSSEFGSSDSDLPSTVYVVEFLSLLARSAELTTADLNDSLRSGQEWLILAARPQGGWSTEIFRDRSWDHLWSTAYLLQRLFAANSPSFPEWSQTLRDAAASILKTATTIKYENSRARLRVEARVAAALASSVRHTAMEPLSQERTESWLSEWERRTLDDLRGLPSKECDLATATFVARGLLRGKNYRKVGADALADIS